MVCKQDTSCQILCKYVDQVWSWFSYFGLQIYQQPVLTHAFSLFWWSLTNDRLMNSICKCQVQIKGDYVRCLSYVNLGFFTTKTKLHCTVQFFIFTWIFNEQNSCRIIWLNEASLIKYWRSKSGGTELFALWLFHLLKSIRSSWWHLGTFLVWDVHQTGKWSSVCSHSWTWAESDNTFHYGPW